MTILWDRNQIHGRSKAVKAYLAKHPEIVTEDFPAYAPERWWSGIRLGASTRRHDAGGAQVPRRFQEVCS
jgi:hypothetical protein